MKYYIIAGEASGDLHASNLIREIRIRDSEAVIRAWGGDLMEANGAEIVMHYRDLAFMGFVEVLFNLRTIVRNLSFCKRDIERFQPDVLVLVDYPGFNLRIAKYAHKKSIKVVYYISPQVWAWKKNRVFSLKKYVDRMLVILPFEQPFFEKYGMEVDFVGHPLLDALQQHRDLAEEEQSHPDERAIVALLPGSRKQEIKRMLPLMCRLASLFPEYQFMVAAAPSIDEAYYNKFLDGFDVKLMKGGTYSLLKQSEAAVVTSGTATLEAALLNVPEVVCYKGNFLSYLIAKRVIRVSYISLVNLIMEKEIVKELIQSDLNSESLHAELKLLLYDAEIRQQLISNYALLREKLKGEGASSRAAKIVTQTAFRYH